MHHDIMFNIEPKKPVKPQTTACRRKGKANAKIIPTKAKEEAKSVEERKRNKAVATVCATRATAAAAIVAGTTQPLVSTNINFDWKPYIWILHFFLHSADPIIAPVPTSGIISPMLAGLKDASPKPALMTS